jgi:hypothetical protein
MKNTPEGPSKYPNAYKNIANTINVKNCIIILFITINKILNVNLIQALFFKDLKILINKILLSEIYPCSDS